MKTMAKALERTPRAEPTAWEGSPLDCMVETLEDILDEALYIGSIGSMASKDFLRAKLASQTADVRFALDLALSLRLLVE